MNFAEEITDQSPKVHIALPILAVVISLAATLVSVDLTYIHYSVHTNPNFSSFCAINETINCDTVANSKFATLWGVPVSIWGFCTYLSLLLLSLTAFLKKRVPSCWPWGLLLPASIGAVGYALFLGYVSHFIIHAFCILCMALYVLNFSLLAVSLVALMQLKIKPVPLIVKNLFVIKQYWKLISAYAVLAIIIAISLIIAVPRYYAHAIPRVTTPPLEEKREIQEEFLSCPQECPAFGAGQPKVTIVEYTDFQCPYCQMSHDVLKQAVKDYGSILKIVHRNFPLDHSCNPIVRQPFHRNACAAAKAAYCAKEQGLFDSYTSLLWKARGGQSDEQREKMAWQAGLELQEFRSCMDSHRPIEAIMRDITSGMRLKIRGTPAFLINGRMLRGALTSQALQAIIESESRQPSEWNKK